MYICGSVNGLIIAIIKAVITRFSCPVLKAVYNVKQKLNQVKLLRFDFPCTQSNVVRHKHKLYIIALQINSQHIASFRRLLLFK